MSNNKDIYNSIIGVIMVDFIINLVAQLFYDSFQDKHIIISILIITIYVFGTLWFLLNAKLSRKFVLLVTIFQFIYCIVLLILLCPKTCNWIRTCSNSIQPPVIEVPTETIDIGKTNSPNDTGDPTETPTPSPSQTPTPEFPNDPITTTEHAETPTPFTPVDEFANSCIPSDWKIYPEYLITLDKININEDCLKLDKLGFKALTQGLQVLASTDEDKGSETAGIYRLLPSDNFRLNIVFKDLELNSSNQNGSILYIMFINSQDALSIASISNFDSLFKFTKYYYLYNNNEYTYSKEYNNFKPDIEYILTCDKIGLFLACGLKGLEKEPDIPEIEFNPEWDSVFIGYYLSGDSSVKINITQFHFIPIEP